MSADLAITIGAVLAAGLLISLAHALARAGRSSMDPQQQLDLDERRPINYALTIACPFCDSPRGQPCTLANGEYAVQPHKMRRRQAALKPVTEEDK